MIGYKWLESELSRKLKDLGLDGNEIDFVLEDFTSKDNIEWDVLISSVFINAIIDQCNRLNIEIASTERSELSIELVVDCCVSIHNTINVFGYTIADSLQGFEYGWIEAKRRMKEIEDLGKEFKELLKPRVIN